MSQDGFFAVAPHVVRRAPLAPVGYKVALELLVKCTPDPLLEVPIVFGPRIAGESKLDRVQIRGYLRHLVRLYRWRLLHPVRSRRPKAAGSPTRAELIAP